MTEATLDGWGVSKRTGEARNAGKVVVDGVEFEPIRELLAERAQHQQTIGRLLDQLRRGRRHGPEERDKIGLRESN